MRKDQQLSIALPGKSCHVYMVLPGETRFTTAGHLEIELDRDGIVECRFVYSRDYIDNPAAVPIDPVELNQLSDKVYRYRTTMNNGVFSSILDSSPDRSYREYIRNHIASRQPCGEIDYLLLSPDDRAGALNFGGHFQPPPPKRNFYKIPDLGRLVAPSVTMISDNETPKESDWGTIRDMTPFHTSMHGGRPKAVVEDAEGLWLAKFESKKNVKFNLTRVEHAMLELAKSCGIRAAPSRVETVEGHDILLVKRFDREKTNRGYLRYRMISGYTALRLRRGHEYKKSWDYARFADQLPRICARPIDDSKELFRRMVFNALISNRGEHPGNLAFIAKHAGWELSPAYDLRPHPNQEPRLLKMKCGIHGRQANARNLLSECERFHLVEEEAVAIIDAMEERVRSCWYRTARDASVSETDCETISAAFVTSSFRHPELASGTTRS